MWPDHARHRRICRKCFPATLQKGQVVKFVRGPFAGLVNKKGQYLDLYLFPKAANLYPVFVKRMSIAVGSNDRLVPLGHCGSPVRLDRHVLGGPPS